MLPLDPSNDGRAPLVGVRFPPERRARLKTIADARGMTMSAYVRSVVDHAMDAEYVDQEVVAEAS